MATQDGIVFGGTRHVADHLFVSEREREREREREGREGRERKKEK
jgi:hypothetical protein